MTNYQELFIEVTNNWDLERIYQDIADARQKITGKNRDITPLEKVCLRGLLSGYSPNDIAMMINREPRGLRVDLSRGLYRYLEQLTGRPINSLKDWRDVSFWLMTANYKYTSNNDSLIKIVDVSLEGSIHNPVIDIKVRNVGSQAAFLKRARFVFNHIWILTSWVFIEPEIDTFAQAAPAAAPAMEMLRRSRQVEPSYGYNFSLPAPTNEGYIESINISQCVSDRDVDRFTFSASVSDAFFQTKIVNRTKFYQSYLYDLQIEIIYDEDNKLVQTPHLLILAENDYPDIIVNRLFFHKLLTQSPDLQAIGKIQEYSHQNQTIIAQLAKIDAIKSPFLSTMEIN
jgi:hypothetical protein